MPLKILLNHSHNNNYYGHFSCIIEQQFLNDAIDEPNWFGQVISHIASCEYAVTVANETSDFSEISFSTRYSYKHTQNHYQR